LTQPEVKPGTKEVDAETEVEDSSISSPEWEEVPSESQEVVVEPGEVEILPAVALDDLLPVEDDDDEEPKSTSRDIVRYDPLEAYLREISRYASLSREEERKLAIDYYENQNKDAAYKLISSNLWLVVKVARDYEKAARSLLDLIQEGNIGLMEAVRNFDPYREVRFPSYAVWWIKAYIVRYVIANWRVVKIGTTQAQRKLFFNLKREKERLEREGFYPGPKLIAANLNVRESDVIEMEQRLGSMDASMDAPLPGDSDSSLLTVLPAGSPSAEDLLVEKQRSELLHNSLEAFKETLSDKERIIFEQRLLSEEKATLQDLAEQFKLSRERIRQIENRVKEKLKLFLTERLGGALESVLEVEP